MHPSDTVVALTYSATVHRVDLREPNRVSCSSVYGAQDSTWRLTFHEQVALSPFPG